MDPLSKWRMDHARQDLAASLGEMIAQSLGIKSAPVDVFDVIQSEEGRLQAFGEDFGEAFDGRLEYQESRFLLFYNTKYDAWSHEGEHHPKVRFSIGHELGHYFLDWHRTYLIRGGGPHGSWTEFISDTAPEREADAFSSGLLMPNFLLGRIVNEEPPTLDAVRRAKDRFAVSLTSMLVRWVHLSDFPCAVISVRNGVIEWGFVSEGFKKAGGFRVHRGQHVASRCAKDFFSRDPSLSTYREGEGWSVANSWIEIERPKIEVHENYIAIPSTRQLLVFLTAREEELADR